MLMICFVIAMESEAAPVLKNMTSVQESLIFNKKVYRGNICGDEAAVVVCGVGKVNAACGTQTALWLGAQAIVNIGVAGGLNSRVKVGNIYAVSHATQYDFDLSQLNGTPVGTLNEFKERWLELALAGEYPEKKLATGDRFNDDRRDYILLTDGFGADIRDMEGGAIAQACINAGVPCFIFKAISDVAGSGSTTEQFTHNLEMCTDKLERNICGIYTSVKQELAAKN